MANKSFNDVLVNVKDDQLLNAQSFGRKMRFERMLEDNRNVGNELFALNTGMDRVILLLLRWMLLAHMTLNVDVSKGGAPPLHIVHGRLDSIFSSLPNTMQKRHYLQPMDF